MTQEFEFDVKGMKKAFWLRWCVSFVVLSVLTAISIAICLSTVDLIMAIGTFLCFVMTLLDIPLIIGFFYYIISSKNTVQKIIIHNDHVFINQDRFEKIPGEELVFELNSDLFGVFPYLSRKLNVVKDNKKVIKSYWFGPCWSKKYKKVRPEVLAIVNLLMEYDHFNEVKAEIANNKIENWSRTEIIFPKDKVKSAFYIEDSMILLFCIAGLLMSRYLNIDDEGLTVLLSILRVVSIVCFFVWIFKAMMELHTYRSMPSKIEVGANGIRIDDKMFLKEEVQKVFFNFRYLSPKNSPTPAIMIIYSRGVRYKYYLGNMNSNCCIEPRRVLMVAINKLFEIPKDDDSGEETEEHSEE